jgi:hypothetical protein
MFKNEDPTIEIWKEKYKHDLVIDVEENMLSNLVTG